MLQGLVDGVTPWFQEWGLLIVFVAVFIESSVVIASFVPGESVLLLGGFFASENGIVNGPPPLDLHEVILVAFAGAVLGDLVGYLIGRVAGRSIVRSVGRFFFLPERRLPVLESYFGRYGGRAILFGRFAPFLRSVRTLVAGAAKMPLSRFVLPDVAGAAAWTIMIGVTGYVLGESWQAANRYLGAGGFVVMLVLLALFILTWRKVRALVERELAAQEAPVIVPPRDDPLGAADASDARMPPIDLS